MKSAKKLENLKFSNCIRNISSIPQRQIPLSQNSQNRKTKNQTGWNFGRETRLATYLLNCQFRNTTVFLTEVKRSQVSFITSTVDSSQEKDFFSKYFVSLPVRTTRIIRKTYYSQKLFQLLSEPGLPEAEYFR